MLVAKPKAERVPAVERTTARWIDEREIGDAGVLCMVGVPAGSASGTLAAACRGQEKRRRCDPSLKRLVATPCRRRKRKKSSLNRNIMNLSSTSKPSS